MENFESQKYRSDLAKEIRQELDKIKRREILTAAKNFLSLFFIEKFTKMIYS